MFRGDPALRGRAAGGVPERPALLWTCKTGGAIHGSAVVSGSIAVVASMDGTVRALHAADGKALWTFDTGASVEATPCVVDGRVFVGDDDGVLHALDLNTGKPAWKYAAGDRILGAANWFRDPDQGTLRILVGSYDFFLHCVDGDTGRQVWRYETDNYINGAPAVANGRAYFGGCDGILHGVDLASGTRAQAVEIDAYIAGSAALEDSFAYLGHYGNEFLCVDLSTGRVVWRYQDREFPFFASPALGEDLVVVGGRDKMVHALRKKTGEAAWTFRTRGRVDSSPVIAGNRVVAASEDGRLYLLDLATGTEVWTYDIGSPVVASPAVTGGRILVGANDGVLYVFGAESTNTRSSAATSCGWTWVRSGTRSSRGPACLMPRRRTRLPCSAAACSMWPRTNAARSAAPPGGFSATTCVDPAPELPTGWVRGRFPAASEGE